MFQRPWPIVVIAVFHILAPIFNLFLSAHLLGVSTSNYFELQMKRDPSFLPLWMLLPVACGISLLTFRRWSYYLFLGFMGLVVIYTLKQRLMSPHRVDFMVFMSLQFINLTVITYFLSPQARQVFLNKKIRWWQQKPRYSISIPAEVILDGKSIPAVIQNISEGGLYLTASGELTPKKRMHIEFPYEKQNYAVEGLIVHVENQNAGILFELGLKEKKQIKKLCRRFKSQNIPIRGRELSRKESFYIWARDLFKSGHGLFPTLPQQNQQNKKG